MERFFLFTKIILLFISLQLFYSCHGLLRDLPEKCPEKMTIELYDGGGMSPEGTSYSISDDVCQVVFWRDQSRDTVKYTLDKNAMCNLYKVFYDNYFEKIKTKEIQTYDRGGISVTLSFAGKNYSVSDAGSTYITESWVKNFYAVVDAITGSASEAIKQNTFPFVVVIDKKMLAPENALYFQVEDQSYNSDSSRNELKSFNLLKGKHNYYVTLMNNTQPSYNRKTKGNYSGILDVTGNNDTLFVTMPDSVIVCREN